MTRNLKEESLDEIRESNEAIAARWQVAQELKDVETAELLMIYKKMIRNLSKSRARVASVGCTSGPTVVEQAVRTIKSLNDEISNCSIFDRLCA